ncbi:LuxR family transcriptional regulator [Ensifer adhaerens]|nr:LuxR family transcriptional regulator [Ensifer adhaerens]HZG30482.1 LuxR family transcriptional regulator [Ensifer sp.]
MSINAIVQFLVMGREHENPKTLIADFEHLLKQYRFQFYGVLIQPRPHQDPMTLVLAGKWPQKWPETYIANRFVLVDPTIRYLGRAAGAFRWKDARRALKSDPQKRRMDQMFKEAAKFGLEDGYIFPIHGRQGLMGNMTLGGLPVELTPVEVSLFEQVAKLMFMELSRFRAREQQSDETEEAPPEIKLTRRELEVLHFLAEGMTSQEIGKVLNLSSHTVDWYMNGIQEKLEARNRQHVVALAFRQGLVS